MLLINILHRVPLSQPVCLALVLLINILHTVPLSQPVCGIMGLFSVVRKPFTFTHFRLDVVRPPLQNVGLPINAHLCCLTTASCSSCFPPSLQCHPAILCMVILHMPGFYVSCSWPQLCETGWPAEDCCYSPLVTGIEK